MKKILALVSLLVLAAACAPAPSGNKDTVNSNSNANKSADTKTVAAPSEADIIAKEKGSWDGFKQKDEALFKKSLAPDYFGVTATGVSDTAASLTSMKETDLTDVTFG